MCKQRPVALLREVAVLLATTLGVLGMLSKAPPS